MTVVLEHNAGDQPVYSPDPFYTRFQTTRTLLDNHDCDGLIDLRNELQAQIDAWQDEYGVEFPKELRGHEDAGDPPQDTDGVHATANEWDLVENRLSIVTDAIKASRRIH